MTSAAGLIYLNQYFFKYFRKYYNLCLFRIFLEFSLSLFKRYLQTTEIVNLGAVCRRYFDLTHDDYLWKKLFAKDFKVNIKLKSGKKAIKYEVYGLGDDEDFAPFANRLPEERFYNRTVIIDVVPNN